MSSQFDASRVYTEALDPDTLAEQDREAAELMQRPIGLANAKLHAERELQGLVLVCNRIAWQEVPGDMREPEPEEIAALLDSLDQDQRDRLMDKAKLAAVQRRLVSVLDEAERECQADLKAAEEQRAQAEAEAREWAEFEAHDAAGKEERFRQWRAAKLDGS